jgi:methylated-DNA-[protein]-cysteine S-methyltransferase
MTHYYSTFPTSFGEFSVGVDDSGAVVRTAFGDLDRLRRGDTASWVVDDGRTAAARGQIGEYFSGRLRTFSLALSAAGSPFQHRVWELLSAIPYGETRSYGEIAQRLESSARAVGGANGSNPICLIVPCHRVIGSDGSLTGFGFGEDLKRRLLVHEGSLIA